MTEPVREFEHRVVCGDRYPQSDCELGIGHDGKCVSFANMAASIILGEIDW